jgi:hypothetical protein
MATKEKEERIDLKESSGGYMAVDRDEALKANLDFIKRLTKKFSEAIAETKTESSQTTEKKSSSKNPKK